MSARRTLLALAAFSMIGLSAPVSAHASNAACASPEQLRELSRFQEKLAGSDTVSDAQDRAERKLKRTRNVLEQAQKLAPNDTELAAATDKLDAMDAAVADARSPGEVAGAFDVAPSAVNASGCDLSTGETIATVLGFILGILPGVILLILLC